MNIPWKYPFYLLVHPFSAFNEMKQHRRGLVKVATVVLFVYFISELISKTCTSFTFQPGEKDINIFLVMLASMLLPVLFALANWCFCTLMEGEGRLSDIYCAVCFSLLPLIIMNFAVTLLSNGMSLNEEVFFTLFNAVKYIWFGLYLFSAVMIIQQYSLIKTIGSIFLTLLGIAVIIFLCVLVFSLFQQLFIFLGTIYNELSFRM